MNKSIGEKIKQLRKELKMTQSILAEPEMTKSMLSHIENGTANPSMKNLQHIASKLNKPISYFLDDNESIEKHHPIFIDEILKGLKEIDSFINNKDFVIAIEKIKKLLNYYTLSSGSKMYSDILYRLGICCIELKEFDEGESYIKKSTQIYIDNMLYIEAARASIQLLKKPLYYYRYSECINISDKAYELYSKSSNRDIFLEIELLAKQPHITIAQGDLDKTIKVCEKAIKLSEENNLYYLTDICYRNMAVAHLIQGNLDEFIIYIEKAKKYVDFTNNKYVLARIYQNYAMYANMINEPIKALNYLKLYEENTDERAFYYYLEIARAEYLLGKYNDAMEALNKVNYKEKIVYLIDCIYILNGKVLKGLILNKFKRYDEAIFSIEEAIKEIEPYTNIEYKGFVKYAYKELCSAYKALSESYYLSENYKEAYSALRKSNELR